MNGAGAPSTLSRRHVRWIVASGSVLWLSGTAWLILHYFGQRNGEFGSEPSAGEPWMMIVHGLAMMTALLAIGGLLVRHVPVGWQVSAQRNKGLVLLSALILLMVTGYLLYYVGGEQIRALASRVHWVLGLALPAAFVWHYLGRRRAEDSKL